MDKPQRVPKPMQEKFDSLAAKTDAFCLQYLNAEYQQLARAALGALARKRASPLLAGTEESWAAAVIHAIGAANFLFDKSQTPHCVGASIFEFFNISTSNGQAKSKKVRDLLKIRPSSAEWTLPSRMADNPFIWMLENNGIMFDVRRAPLEIQEMAFQRGLIPWVPGKQ